MKKKYILFFTCLLTASIYAQSSIDNLSKSVGRISFIDKTTQALTSGTGTLIFKSNPNSPRIFLVTCKHLLPARSQNDSIKFEIKNSRTRNDNYFRFRLLVYAGETFHSQVKIAPDGDDIAIIDLTSLFLQGGEILDLIKYMLTSDKLLSKDSIKTHDIGIGTEVFFMSYPNHFFDSRNISPLLRVGVIATSPSDDYFFSDELIEQHFIKLNDRLPNGIRGFLIDANVFPGSSGSMIFSKPSITFKNQVICLSSEIFGLGVLTSSYIDLTVDGSQIQRVQLGGVISASQIIKTMALFK